MNKVLLVRLSSMGDLIHTFPAIQDLSVARPDISLSWLCEEAFTDIAKLHPFVQSVYPMAWRRWRKTLWQKQTRQAISSLQQQLQTSKFDFVVDSQSLIKSALFANMAKAPVYGLDKHSARESLASMFYQKKLAVAKGQLAIERNRQLFAQIFNYPIEPKIVFGAKVSTTMDDLPWRVSSDYAVLLHATSKPSKLWSEENWQQLAQALWQQKGLVSYLPWGNEEEKLRAQRLSKEHSFIHVCPKLTLKEAAILLQGSCVVVGVDTGLLHLANALNKPLCGIYTDTNPELTGVVPSECAVNLGGVNAQVSVEQVLDVLEQVMV
ncbi:lipopolysaccharide heptosyltransferase I [Neisseria sp. Ec49-e6-T10]|uniref:lipopolysaccharide heptosyltransferase I n=1 Tax=Neisseria sp. Ec49-e6-T10 TaxID=3140744 RepID=UPI003EB98FE0